MFSIRRASPADRDALVAFHRALYIDYRNELVPEALRPLSAYRDFERALRDDVAAMLKNPASVVLIAEQDGRAVGYATGHVEDDPRRELSRKGVVEDWFVEESARGRGIGKELLDALLAIFREVGCSVAESTTWPTNDLARHAHERAGFSEIEIKFRRRL
jgi:GNAT superfamily N-acetyltransferase